MQKPVEVRPDDTPEVLQRRIMEQAEWQIMPKVIDLIAHDKVHVKDGRVFERSRLQRLQVCNVTLNPVSEFVS